MKLRLPTIRLKTVLVSGLVIYASALSTYAVFFRFPGPFQVYQAPRTKYAEPFLIRIDTRTGQTWQMYEPRSDILDYSLDHSTERWEKEYFLKEEKNLSEDDRLWKWSPTVMDPATPEIPVVLTAPSYWKR